MSKFIFNTHYCKKYCEELKNILTKYHHSRENYFNELLSIKNSWNEPTTIAFLKKVNKENMISAQHFESIKRYLNNLEIFNTELKNIIRSYFDITEINKISYNSKNILEANKILDNKIVILDTIKDDFTKIKLPNNPQLEMEMRRLFADLDIQRLKSIRNTNYNSVRRIESLIAESEKNVGLISRSSTEDVEKP